MPTPLEEVSAAVLAVSRQLSVREVLQTIVTAARGLLDCQYAALGVPDDQGGFAEFVVDGVPDEQRAAIGPMPRQHGLLAAMLTDPKPQRLDDVRRDPRFGWWPQAHPVLKDFIGVPINDGREILGALYLANSKRGKFTDDDERLLAVLAAHAAIALTNARLFEQSRELALLEERQRVARELHDAVAQKLFSLRLITESAACMVRRDPDRAERELAEIKQLAALAASELTEVVAEMRPRELADAGLAETLRRRVALLDRIHLPELRFVSTVKQRFPAKIEEAMLRVAEEALHNALRHSGAKNITLELSIADGVLGCEIRDDGVGIDPEDVKGLGLASMRERAERVHGTLTVTQANPGTILKLAVPLD
ncbi:GAF domain-containing sensor histidine kinase [Catelliglobosispora koreensis]|uniref:GAF domain-containing sensor histidine kinase n=1 Tax=Catelliglobosispora koreensis TaxID=129052 RepID=UPI000363DE81|nr:GAF domain-containing sensor histidine kinase [Catelliglobosispora koreensis]